MDDDPMLREVLGKMLRTLGYEATGAKDGLEALESVIEGPKPGDPFPG